MGDAPFVSPARMLWAGIGELRLEFNPDRLRRQFTRNTGL
jgi:hypothetical protein